MVLQQLDTHNSSFDEDGFLLNPTPWNPKLVASIAHFDEDGFLLNPTVWNPKLAASIAQLDGLPNLTNDHWYVIYYLREHHLNHGTLPVMRHVCLANGLERHCVTDLFHDAKEAWRVAGLPNPGEEAKSYM
ncbi:MAG: TusE/DsrC/DsvC family sulfur relay protein [Gammaproteobacteria bacterium]|jgi:tRNA 2-thiouridine synthesizing protein E|nr:TusE/DsrC/DsvC family sulfur relay protein [Gammaproteobacteria bacterium]